MCRSGFTAACAACWAPGGWLCCMAGSRPHNWRSTFAPVPSFSETSVNTRTRHPPRILDITPAWALCALASRLHIHECECITAQAQQPQHPSIDAGSQGAQGTHNQSESQSQCESLPRRTSREFVTSELFDRSHSDQREKTGQTEQAEQKPSTDSARREPQQIQPPDHSPATAPQNELSSAASLNAPPDRPQPFTAYRRRSVPVVYTAPAETKRALFPF